MLRARPRPIALALSVPTAHSTPARTRDTDAHFERLYAEHQPAILNYIYRLVGEAALAEDLVQEAFTRAWRARAQLSGVENPRAWLYRIATNAARDHLRRARLLRWLPLAPSDRRLAVQGHEEASLESARMQQALLTLSPDYRIPLVLYTCQDGSIAEIAAVMGLSTDAVKQRLSRARQKLREAYRS